MSPPHSFTGNIRLTPPVSWMSASWQSTEQMLRYFSLDQSGWPTDQQTDLANPTVTWIARLIKNLTTSLFLEKHVAVEFLQMSIFNLLSNKNLTQLHSMFKCWRKSLISYWIISHISKIKAKQFVVTVVWILLSSQMSSSAHSPTHLFEPWDQLSFRPGYKVTIRYTMRTKRYTAWWQWETHFM